MTRTRLRLLGAAASLCTLASPLKAYGEVLLKNETGLVCFISRVPSSAGHFHRDLCGGLHGQPGAPTILTPSFWPGKEAVLPLAPGAVAVLGWPDRPDRGQIAHLRIQMGAGDTKCFLVHGLGIARCCGCRWRETLAAACFPTNWMTGANPSSRHGGRLIGNCSETPAGPRTSWWSTVSIPPSGNW